MKEERIVGQLQKDIHQEVRELDVDKVYMKLTEDYRRIP